MLTLLWPDGYNATLKFKMAIFRVSGLMVRILTPIVLLFLKKGVWSITDNQI